MLGWEGKRWLDLGGSDMAEMNQHAGECHGIMVDIRTVIRMVFDGGEGCTRGGRSVRSRESCGERECRDEEDRDGEKGCCVIAAMTRQRRPEDHEACRMCCNGDESEAEGESRRRQ